MSVDPMDLALLDTILGLLVWYGYSEYHKSRVPDTSWVVWNRRVF